MFEFRSLLSARRYACLSVGVCDPCKSVVVFALFLLHLMMVNAIGTARGSLGRHTGLREDGQPDLNHRTTVFEKVLEEMRVVYARWTHDMYRSSSHPS